jgi:Predicted membrane protein
MLLIIIGLFLSQSLYASERITRFKSDITVCTDGSLLVREDITINAQLKQIRRGITREVPTQYKDRMGNFHNVGFQILTVLMDGAQSPYFVESVSNGKIINFGDDSFLKSGLHTFTIEYRTTRQLGFFEDHDELYWNVTGNGWRFSIDQAEVTVHLPQAVARDEIKFVAFTGYQGQRDSYYTAQLIDKGVRFLTTRSLSVYQGFTIVVGWPKGIIAVPTLWQKTYWFFDDNKHILLLIITLFLLCLYYWLVSKKVYARRPTAPIIPLFYPPENMLPGGMRYYAQMKYDNKVLAADVVNMGVQGLMAMEYKPGWMQGAYTLTKKDAVADQPLYKKLIQDLFEKNDTLLVGSANNKSVQVAVNSAERYYQGKCDSYFDYNIKEIAYGVIISMVFFCLLLPIVPHVSWAFIGFALYALITLIFNYNLRGYTYQGWLLKYQIDGFKLFLVAAEVDRIKIIGTPPIKTPELYETYLPYAIALGVEEAWSQQFAPLFQKMAQAGNPYTPLWMYGYSRSGIFDSSSFASGFSNSINSAISSSATIPGSSSGFGNSGGGGGGFSGGGGGGGGGGGR